MKKFKSLMMLLLALATSTNSHASSLKQTFTFPEMSPMNLPESLWQADNYYCSPVSNAAVVFAEKQQTAASRYHEALVGVLNDAKKQRVYNLQKGLVAQNINGRLMLHHPKDCPGYQEDHTIYELPPREKYL